MSYRITTYQEGYIPLQFAIGSELYDPWPMGGQTRPQQLEAAYNSENFTPDTRFYAFDGDQMIGFLTASVKEQTEDKNYYFFEFPYVKKEYQPEVEQLLIDHALKALKDHGADVLVTRAGDYWGNSKKWAEHYGFIKTQDIARRAELQVDQVDLDQFEAPSTLVDFDAEQHLQPLAEMYAQRFNTTAENMSQQLQRWSKLERGDSFKSPWDHTLTLLTHKILEQDGKVIGRLVGMHHSNFADDTISLSQLILQDDDPKYVSAFLRELVETAKAHGKRRVVIHTGLWGSFPTDEPYKPFDLDFEMKLAYYEKQL